MAGYLIDSDVLIEHLRGNIKVTEFIYRLYMEAEPLQTSVICEAELFSNVFDSERGETDDLFRYIEPLPVDSVIAREAAVYRRRHRRSHSLELADTLIAATAKAKGCKLVTRNTKHFPMRDIEIVSPK